MFYLKDCHFAVSAGESNLVAAQSLVVTEVVKLFGGLYLGVKDADTKPSSLVFSVELFGENKYDRRGGEGKKPLYYLTPNNFSLSNVWPEFGGIRMVLYGYASADGIPLPVILINLEDGTGLLIALSCQGAKALKPSDSFGV